MRYSSSKYTCLARLLPVQSAFETTVIDEQMWSIVDMDILKLVIAYEFWDRVANIYRLLQPVAKGFCNKRVMFLRLDLSVCF